MIPQQSMYCGHIVRFFLRRTKKFTITTDMEQKNKMSSVAILKEVYESRLLMNKSYSIRAFARDLQISPSMLSDVLRGARRLSPSKALQISEHLKLNPEEKSFFIALVQAESLKSRRDARLGQSFLDKATAKQSTKSLGLESFKLISDWHHYAVLCVMELDSYNGSPEFIQKHLGLDDQLIYESLNILCSLELAVKKDNQYFCSEVDVTTTHNIASVGLRKYHRQLLAKASDSLESTHLFERDVTSMTMSIDKDKIPVAKNLIAKFRRDLCNLLEEGNKNDVYSLCIQLFPLGESYDEAH